MKRYRIKPRFYIICLLLAALIVWAAVSIVDARCSAAYAEEKPAVAEPEPEPEPDPEPEEAEPVSLGEFTITHYCSCAVCCNEYAVGRPVDENGQEIVYTASGARAEAGRTIAVDPDVIPLGSAVIINGHEYIAQDTGGAIQGNRIDIYCSSHEEAKNMGIITAEVFKDETH